MTRISEKPMDVPSQRHRATKIVLVGHCTPDAYALCSAVRRGLGDTETIAVTDESSLAPHLGPGVLLLINRVLEGDFLDEDGVTLIGRAAAAGAAALLVSDLPDAQSRAIQAGARPGFGKRAMNTDRAAQLLRDAVA